MSLNDEMLFEVLTTLHTLFQDENILEQCRAREEYYYREKQHMEALQKVEELTVENQKLSDECKRLSDEHNSKCDS